MHLTEYLLLVIPSLAAGYAWYRLSVPFTVRRLLEAYRQSFSNLDAPQPELLRQAGRQFQLLGLLALQFFLIALPLGGLLVWWHLSRWDMDLLFQPLPLLLSTLSFLAVALRKRCVHSGYSGYAVLLHRFAMGSRAAARAGLDLTLSRWKDAPVPLDVVYITGLSRCGSTALLQHLEGSIAFASLRYADMPFPLMPGLMPAGRQQQQGAKAERGHGDGVLSSPDSPEAFEEFFWQVHSPQLYDGGGPLEPQPVPRELMERYAAYLSAVCAARGRKRYLAKNNNLVLRLEALRELPLPHRVLLLFREPLAQADSLWRMHRRFSAMQREEPFILWYFDQLGHYEFGLHSRPFRLPGQKLTDAFPDPASLDHWLARWTDYHAYILAHYGDEVLLLRFEDLCHTPEEIYPWLFRALGLNHILIPAPFKPKTREYAPYDPALLQHAEDVYVQLLKSRRYPAGIRLES